MALVIHNLWCGDEYSSQNPHTFLGLSPHIGRDVRRAWGAAEIAEPVADMRDFEDLHVEIDRAATLIDDASVQIAVLIGQKVEPVIAGDVEAIAGIAQPADESGIGQFPVRDQPRLGAGVFDNAERTRRHRNLLPGGAA